MSWSRFFRRRRWDEERARELEAYLEVETDENIARGMSPQEARYAARRKLGNITQDSRGDLPHEQPRLAGNALARPAVRYPHAGAESRLYGHGGANPGAGHWRHHGYFHGCQCRASSSLALPASRATGLRQRKPRTRRGHHSFSIQQGLRRLEEPEPHADSGCRLHHLFGQLHRRARGRASQFRRGQFHVFHTSGS